MKGRIHLQRHFVARFVRYTNIIHFTRHEPKGSPGDGVNFTVVQHWTEVSKRNKDAQNPLGNLHAKLRRTQYQSDISTAELVHPKVKGR